MRTPSKTLKISRKNCLQQQTKKALRKNSSNNQFIIRESDEEDETALPEQEQEEIVDDADVIEDGAISSPALQALREGLITSQQFVEIEMFRH